MRSHEGDIVFAHPVRWRRSGRPDGEEGDVAKNRKKLMCLVAVFAALAAHHARAGHQTPGEKCAVTKLKATFKKAAAKGACYGKAVAANVPVDSGCLVKAEQAFLASFQKAEAKGGCATTGDAAAIEGAVDAFVAQVVNALPPAPTTSTTSTTTTTTTLPACGDAAAPQCNGTCPQPATCAFVTSSGTCQCGVG